VHGPPAPRCSPANKLSDAEFDELLDLLNSPDFVDLAPAQVWAILLDAGTYLASISTMYRVLRTESEVRERRRQATHPPRVRPELVARRPNEVWSWDISKLKGPSKGVYYDLYVIIDIFSRYVVGWMVAPTETAELAKAFLAATIKAHGITAKVLTIHADRGTSMTSKPVAVLLAELGVARTHSRPHVSNDNPYSEAAFKTLKYCPAFPERFGSIEDARTFCAEFFEYYNHHHRHSGIALHTPASMHFGTAQTVQAERAETLRSAYAANPRRFCNRQPSPPKMPTIAWINKPTITNDAQKKS
jgi:putative transposase